MREEGEGRDIGISLTGTLDEELMALMYAIEDPDGDCGPFDLLITPLDIHNAHFTLISLFDFGSRLRKDDDRLQPAIGGFE